MSEKRRGLGRGLGALIPTADIREGVARPVDVFFPDRRAEATGSDDDSTSTAARVEGGSVGAKSTTSGTAEGGSTTETTSGSDGSTPNAGSRKAAGSDAPGDAGIKAGTRDVAEAEAGSHTAASGAGGGTAKRSRLTADDSADLTSTDDGLVPVPGATFAELPVEMIRPNPRQPRTVFDEDALAELVGSIKEIGVLQPVVVRPVDDGYELIMGERRLRATQEAGLDAIPAIIRETDDSDLLRDALLENLHRSQLNPLEEAAAYQQLLDDFGCTHEELAARIHRSRPQISNTLRLLRLPALVQRRVAAGVLSAGHARALLGLGDGAAIERLAQRIVAEGLSVRAVEEIVSLGGDQEPTRRKQLPRAGMRNDALNDLASRLSDRFETRVKVDLGKNRGKLTVEFASVQDLNRILASLAPDDPGVFKG